MNVRISIGAGLAGALVAAATFGSDPPRERESSARAEFEEQARARAYRIGLRIEPTWMAPPGRCLEVGLEDLRVTLRGKAVDAESLRLERVHQRTVHALLIDTSWSMLGDLAAVRRAATAYLERVDLSRDRALIISFDTNVVMAQAATTDRTRLTAALDGLRFDYATSLNDALVLAVHELESFPERPVILLLTDGIGMSGLHDREDVLAALGRRPDSVVFTIGMDIPPLLSCAPPGVNSARRFLQRVARSSHGRFFEPPTPGRLEEVYRRIGEMLETEAVVTATDPDPALPAATLRVRSLEPGCRVQTYPFDEISSATRSADSEESFDRQATSLRLEPLESLRGGHGSGQTAWADPECAPPGADDTRLESPEPLWRIEDGGDRLRACILDITMDQGLLYDPWGDRYHRYQFRLGTKTRAVEIPVPDLGQVPRRPEHLLDRLAVLALERRHDEIERDPRLHPVEAHARPFHDCPMLINGMSLAALQEPVARLLVARGDFRAWFDERMRAETRRALDALTDRYRERFPDLDETRLRETVTASEEGRRLRARVADPSDAELRHFLAAWLGDISAHDLFARWEARQIDRTLQGREDRGFGDRWDSLRELFFVPSYVRSLVLLSLGHDSATDRIGFWRVILPRPGWIDIRRRGYKRPPGAADLPLDLVPDRPLGLWLVESLVESSRPLAAHLRDGCAVESLRYRLRGKSGKHDPRRAFRETSVDLALTCRGRASGPLRLRAEIDLESRDGVRRPRLVALATDEAADDGLARWIEDAGRRIRQRSDD